MLHLFNATMAVNGEEAYNATIQTLRHVYQTPVAEAGLALTLVVHILVGGILHWKRDRFGFKSAPTAPWVTRIHRWAGSLLSVMILGHVSGTRLNSLTGVNKLDDFGHMHIFFRLAPHFALPYFFLYVVTAVLHMYIGIAKAIESLGLAKIGFYRRVTSHWAFWFIIVVTISAASAGMLGMYNGPISKAAKDYWLPILLEHHIPPAIITGSL